MIDDSDPRPKKKTHDIGQDIAALSVFELEERIALLRDEIVRLETAISAKNATKAAADLFFKPSG